MKTVLRVSGLKKSFGNNEVLKNIDLMLTSGEIIVLVAPSGGEILNKDIYEY